MCHETSDQIAELLEGVKPTTLTKGLKMLATNQDRNFLSIEKNISNLDTGLNIKLDKAFSEILELMKSNKLDTDQKLFNNKEDIDKQINKLQKESDLRISESKKLCEEHKKELKEKFVKIDTVTEDLNYFKKNPKLFIILILAIVLVIGYALGTSDIFGAVKAIK